MKHHLLFSLLLIAILRLQGQPTPQGALEGYITDAATGLPIAGAGIVLTQSDPLIAATTNSEGYFHLQGIPAGVQQFYIYYSGYCTEYPQSIRIHPGQTATLQIPLKKMTVRGLGLINPHYATYRWRQPQAIGIQQKESHTRQALFPTLQPAKALSLARLQGEPNTLHKHSLNGLALSLNPAEALQIKPLVPIAITAFTADFATARPTEWLQSSQTIKNHQLTQGNKQQWQGRTLLATNQLGAQMDGPFRSGGRLSYQLAYYQSTAGIFSLPGTAAFRWQPEQPWRSAWAQLHWAAPNKHRWQVTLHSQQQQQQHRNDTNARPFFDYPLNSIRGHARANWHWAAITHKYQKTDKVYWLTRLSGGMQQSQFQADSGALALPLYNAGLRYQQQQHLVARLHTIRSQVLPKGHIVRVGATMQWQQFQYTDSIRPAPLAATKAQQEVAGQWVTAGIFGDWLHRFSSEITLYHALRLRYFTANRRLQMEPTSSVQWKPTPPTAWRLAVAMQSETLPAPVYAFEQTTITGFTRTPNQHLHWVKSLHYQLQWEHHLQQYRFIQANLYYRHYYNLPTLAVGDQYWPLWGQSPAYYGFSQDIASAGQLTHYGIAVQAKQSLQTHWQWELTGFVGQSDFQRRGQEKQTHPYAADWGARGFLGFVQPLGRRAQLNTWLQITFSQGIPYIPADTQASRQANTTVWNVARAYRSQSKHLLFQQAGLSFLWNHLQWAQEWQVQVYNPLNYKNFSRELFQPATQRVVAQYRSGRMVKLSLRLYF